MNKTIGIVILGIFTIAALFALVIWGGKSAVSDISNDVTIHEDAETSRAPYFDLVDVSGNRVQLSSFQDEPVIIFFWATWDESSANQLKIYDDYLSHGGLVKVLAIDSQEDASIVSSFMRRGGYKVPVALDERGVASEAYKVKSLPTSAFIGRDGTLLDVATGLLSEKTIVDKAEKLLK